MLDLNNFSQQLGNVVEAIQANLLLSLQCVSVLWVVHIVNILLGRRLNIFGIYPRKIWGLIGIPCSPFLHANFSHLFLNSIPLVILIDLLLSNGTSYFLHLTIIVTTLGGLATWMFGRPAIHIGASHIIMGYWGFLLMNAYRNPSVVTIILAIICLYYFGGMLLNLFPQEEKTSWEGHLFGFLAGVGAVYFSS